mgnify:CR=1 FL=1
MAKHHLWNHRNRGLWLLALLIVIIGGGITWMLHSEASDPTQRQGMLIALAVTILGCGLCIICATSEWWLHR